MSKVLNCKNGLADRILTLYGQRDSISLDETAHMLIICTNRVCRLCRLYDALYMNKHIQSIIQPTKTTQSGSW